MKYLVKMTPLELYTFGTEISYKFTSTENSGKTTYFVRSKEVPEQTTVFGMLRYAVLKNEGLLKSSFHYTSEELDKLKSCIGRESFQFSSKEKQDFGYLKNISPVFLIDENNNYYIKNPLHNKSSKQGYEPMKLTEETIKTSAGEIKLPRNGEYNSKKGYVKGYYNLTDGSIKDNLFKTYVFTGNKCMDKEVNNDEGFFKREVTELEKGFSFAVFVTLDDKAKRLAVNDILYMGQKKSAFFVSAIEVEKDDLTEKVKKAFSSKDYPWFYALSDLVISDKVEYSTFCIVEDKHIRNLETVYQESKYVSKIKRNKVQFSLINHGSVFYETYGFDLSNENCKQIGYNQIIKLGGK